MSVNMESENASVSPAGDMRVTEPSDLSEQYEEVENEDIDLQYAYVVVDFGIKH